MATIKWNDPPDHSYNTASILQRAHEQSQEDKALGRRVESKAFHYYKGFTASKNDIYQNLWGPVLDSSQCPVDGLPGVYNHIPALERAIDQYLHQKAIQDKRKQDNLARHGKLPALEPSPIAETTDDTEPPKAVYRVHPDKELAEKIA